MREQLDRKVRPTGRATDKEVELPENTFIYYSIPFLAQARPKQCFSYTVVAYYWLLLFLPSCINSLHCSLQSSSADGIALVAVCCQSMSSALCSMHAISLRHLHLWCFVVYVLASIVIIHSTIIMVQGCNLDCDFVLRHGVTDLWQPQCPLMSVGFCRATCVQFLVY